MEWQKLSPAAQQTLIVAIRRYWRRQGVRPRRLPCGCLLGPCPCCGRWELVIDPSGRCRLGSAAHPEHKRWIDRDAPAENRR